MSRLSIGNNISLQRQHNLKARRIPKHKTPSPLLFTKFQIKEWTPGLFTRMDFRERLSSDEGEKKGRPNIATHLFFFNFLAFVFFYSFMDLTHDVPSSPIGRRIKPPIWRKPKKTGWTKTLWIVDCFALSIVEDILEMRIWRRLKIIQFGVHGYQADHFGSPIQDTRSQR